MSSISIQFYAMPDENNDFVRRWMESEGLHAAAIEYHPFAVLPIAREAADEGVQCEGGRRLVFAERPIDCSASSNTQLLDKNEGVLVLDIGRLGPFGLTESHLKTSQSTARWRKIAADIKKNTEAGMVGVNEQSGATAEYRSLRYTNGAATLAASGTPLRPFEQSPVRLRTGR
ncbi:hypothetical protein [Chondromyces crocatus]|uniref:Uncharacterized protein n=1 Tax=Chondromyces crocatus TaxID=52 RepID=A0A0K1EPF1_CHOCO|nr:hypothetical protein [Chondromyces crocatus]AKT42726.1 uncharacterized protein CMC5_069530 [Chondromyces crocatus]